MTWKELKKLKQNIKRAIKKDYEISNLITYIPNTDLFEVSIFVRGPISVVNSTTKEIFRTPAVISEDIIMVPYKDLLRFMKIIMKMITIYEKILIKK